MTSKVDKGLQWYLGFLLEAFNIGAKALNIPENHKNSILKGMGIPIIESEAGEKCKTEKENI